nr:hypothetical protein [Tanacetum cinerariifolium]
ELVGFLGESDVGRVGIHYPLDFESDAVEKEEEKGGFGFGGKKCKQCIAQ